VRHQRTLWEWCLNLRIRLQKPLTTMNRAPQYDVYPTFRSLNTDVNQRYQEAVVKSGEMISKLINLQHELIQQNQTLPQKIMPPQSQNSTSGYWATLQNDFQVLLPWYEKTIDKWNKKTQQTSGHMALADKKFKVINQSVVSQIQSMMKSPEELIKKTQLKRLDYTILGKRKSTSSENPDYVEDESTLAIEGRKEEYDPEILDDTDFYQGLLRDIIQSGLEYNSTLENPELLEKAKVGKKKPRKKRDRIAKDKKIRYVVHPKLVNFMAPIVLESEQTFVVDELLSGLFGQKPNSTPSKPTAT